MKLFLIERRANGVIGRLLVRVQRMHGAHRPAPGFYRSQHQLHQFLASQRSRGHAGLANLGVQVPQIVNARMQFQKGQQFAFVLGEFACCIRGPRGKLHLQSLRRSAHRIALRRHDLGFHKTAFFQ